MATPFMAPAGPEAQRVDTSTPLAKLADAMKVSEATDLLPLGAPAFQPPSSQRRIGPAMLVCPRCGSADMRPTKNPSLGVRMLAAIGMTRCRCRQCGKRSWWL